jgi:hypothetical protein
VRTVWDREAASSNLAAPTIRRARSLIISILLLFLADNPVREKEVFIFKITLEVNQNYGSYDTIGDRQRIGGIVRNEKG